MFVEHFDPVCVEGLAVDCKLDGDWVSRPIATVVRRIGEPLLDNHVVRGAGLYYGLWSNAGAEVSEPGQPSFDQLDIVHQPILKQLVDRAG